MTKIKDLKSKWLFVAPISGLELTESTNSEFKIGNVILVTKKKLPKIRKRLGIQYRISELSKFGIKENVTDFFSYSNTYAVCSFTGTPEEKRTENIRIIEDALNLMSFSNLGYSRRKFQSKIEIKRSKGFMHYRMIALDKINKRYSLNFTKLHPMPIEPNENWLRFHKSFFYLKLFSIINGEKKINTKWKNILISVAKLVGKSLNSHDIPEAFLQNVIALEMLLVSQGEKIEEKLIERSEYFLDWCADWINDKIEDKLKIIYKKRCDYVHDGKTQDITKDDLIFTDDLIFNLMNNILNHIEKISSKGKLIEFSDKYLAEKKLGLESNYQFGEFQFVRKTYDKVELGEI
ncbi:HEPN domain-containing protein [Arenibacter sp. S6351L]|uniref:HEPN domain-containing protein n=1 Tax=Arenibacter sp. S6351L TaxID=2926407 RepID=UPI001FF55F97|nr:HEPN domain-containing protein [Arenibacter sp. S6351L]MCK0137379.1 HEPN domain-containing protein [Arenibacter sp. S6351L]